MYRILIVEDEAPIAYMYQFKLEQSGYEVLSVADGQSGFEAAETFSPQLILLDLRLPGMSGDEMLKEVRQQKWGGSIRVIILTNISRAEAPPSLRLLNVDRFIVKAHNTPAQVVQVVNDILKVRSQA